jgi:hypothetical protein
MVSKSIRTDCVVEYYVRCPRCERGEKATIRVPDELQILGKKAPDYAGVDDITLPDSKDVVTFRPMTVGDNMWIMERDAEKRQKLPDLIAGILLPIKAVGGGSVDNTDEILNWYDALSPKDAEFLKTEQGKLHPQLNTAVQHKCDSCGEKFTYDLDLNRDFFRVGER